MNGWVSGGSPETAGKIPEERPGEGEGVMKRKVVATAERADRNLSFAERPRAAASGFCRNEACADGVSNEPRYVMDIQPAHQFAAMRVNGLHAQPQRIGDVFC